MQDHTQRNLTRMQSVQTPIIPVVADLIRQHPDTISLGQGMVYYGPPPAAIARMSDCLSQPDIHKYQAIQGIPPLREAIATKLKTENRISASSEQVIVTAGSNMGFLNAVLAITQPGDEVIIQSPFYFNHEMAIAIAGCQPVIVPTDEQFQLQPEAIRAAITARTRAIVTISPNNPTGVVYTESALRAVNDLCRSHGIYHISDEAYEYFTYDDATHSSPAAFPDSSDHTISLFSLSKAYGFASWRIGYMVIPNHLQAAIAKIQDTNVICPPVVSQYAALGALEVGAAYCRERLGEIVAVREVMLRSLHSLHPRCTIPPTKGAFYFLLKLPTDLSPMQLVERLIREYRVAAIPGSAFGIDRCSIRVGYGALDRTTATEGIKRLTHGLKGILER